eukprot:TRINITY_DN2703_c0_g1_i1.p1 TRINITY_DN2703_c0_g1~~TRINITY_DN2703_c0_g1_i1.p1  ORF type:complete len:239 (+),score=44.84 TRINITY_DN2703_c0_g1_i1:331-1047(+)
MSNYLLSAISKKKRKFDEIPSLLSLTIDTLRANIDSIGSIDGIPSELALRIFETATVDQLDRVENATGRVLPYLDELWKKHYITLAGPRAAEEIQPVKGKPISWRKLYKLKKRENDEKFQKMGEKMVSSYSVLSKQKNEKKTQVIDKPPPSAAKKVNTLPKGSTYYNTGKRPASGSGSSSTPTLSKIDKLRKDFTKQNARIFSPIQKVGSGVGKIVPPKDIRPGLQTAFSTSKKPKTY